MLQDARAPAVDLDAHGVALEVGARDEHRLGAAQREPLARERQAAFGFVIRVRLAGLERAHPQLGIDDHAAPWRAVVVRVAVREDPQPDADLRGRETHAGRGIHRLEHVGDERSDLIRDLADAGGGSVEDGVAHDANRQNGHALSLPIGIGD